MADESASVGLKQRVTAFLENSDPRPPYVEDKGKRSAVSGVLGLLLIPAFFILCYFVIPGFIYTPRKYICFCATTAAPTPDNQWLFDLATQVRGQQRHFPLTPPPTPQDNPQQPHRFSDAVKAGLCAVRYTQQEVDTSRLQFAQSPAQFGYCLVPPLPESAVTVVVREYGCTGKQPGESCDGGSGDVDCPQRNSAWLASSFDAQCNLLGAECASGENVTSLDALDQNARRVHFWSFYEELVCPSSPNARWCQAVPSMSQDTLYDQAPRVPPLCSIPPAASVVLAIGSIFGLLMGVFVNAPAGARLIWLRIEYRKEQPASQIPLRSYLTQFAVGIRNSVLGLLWFGFLYTVMAADSTAASRLGAQTALSFALTWFPWKSYFGRVFGDQTATLTSRIATLALLASAAWLVVSLVRLLFALQSLFGTCRRPRVFERGPACCRQLGWALDFVLPLGAAGGWLYLLIAVEPLRQTSLVCLLVVFTVAVLPARLPDWIPPSTIIRGLDARVLVVSLFGLWSLRTTELTLVLFGPTAMFVWLVCLLGLHIRGRSATDLAQLSDACTACAGAGVVFALGLSMSIKVGDQDSYLPLLIGGLVLPLAWGVQLHLDRTRRDGKQDGGSAGSLQQPLLESADSSLGSDSGNRYGSFAATAAAVFAPPVSSVSSGSEDYRLNVRRSDEQRAAADAADSKRG